MAHLSEKNANVQFQAKLDRSLINLMQESDKQKSFVRSHKLHNGILQRGFQLPVENSHLSIIDFLGETMKH